MSTYEIAVNVFEWLTLSTTLMLRISLIPDFRRMHKCHSTGEMSVMPSLLLFTNCYVGLFYAIAVNNMMPLLAQAIVGVVAGVFFNYFFYRWTENKLAVVKAFAGSFAVCLIVTIYSILALAGHMGQSRESISTTLGFMTIGTSVGMYVSPMATIATVLQTKTASSMPFTMGVVNVFNSFNWATYAALIDNKFILGPNIAGFILGCTQLILTFIYRPKPSDIADEAKPDGTLSVMVISPHNEKVVPSTNVKSPSFLAVTTPYYEDPFTARGRSGKLKSLHRKTGLISHQFCTATFASLYIHWFQDCETFRW
ncbi:unnamed protein product [Peronospora destructor]|uniref:Sugar transporter SWEET1 n=1 Tax=Peronospora destructor TaxID=86335 RepID=A0AAV0SUU8_9STRA|nr:unnamed protein product [Peronospora destructor]